MKLICLPACPRRRANTYESEFSSLPPPLCPSFPPGADPLAEEGKYLGLPRGRGVGRGLRWGDVCNSSIENSLANPALPARQAVTIHTSKR